MFSEIKTTCVSTLNYQFMEHPAAITQRGLNSFQCKITKCLYNRNKCIKIKALILHFSNNKCTMYIQIIYNSNKQSISHFREIPEADYNKTVQLTIQFIWKIITMVTIRHIYLIKCHHLDNKIIINNNFCHNKINHLQCLLIII